MTPYLTDNQYEQEAKKYLFYFKMQLSFENIGIIKNWLMKADLKYKEGIGTREGFRYFYAKCACKTIIRDSKRKKFKLVSYDQLTNNIESKTYIKYPNTTTVEELIQGSNLTNFEKEVITEYFLNKNSIKIISENTKKSKQYIHSVKNNALAKLRKNENES